MNHTCQSCIRHSPMDKCCTLDGSTKGKTHKACSQWQHRPGHKDVRIGTASAKHKDIEVALHLTAAIDMEITEFLEGANEGND